MRIDEFLKLLDSPRKKRATPPEWTCKCPAHEDKARSLHVSLGRNQRGAEIIRVKCFAGCDLNEILGAMKLTSKDLVCGPVEDKPITLRTARQFVADWFGFDYRRVNISGYQTDEDGNCISVQFRVNSFARLRYLARRRTAEAEWELIPLP